MKYRIVRERMRDGTWRYAVECRRKGLFASWQLFALPGKNYYFTQYREVEKLLENFRAEVIRKNAALEVVSKDVVRVFNG